MINLLDSHDVMHKQLKHMGGGVYQCVHSMTTTKASARCRKLARELLDVSSNAKRTAECLLEEWDCEGKHSRIF